jgi:L-ascorbate metabolism protein UlaG (beta-lactamase superfamily)
MIQPAQSGPALFQDIETTHPGAGEIAIWWLGQSGYAIKTTSALFYIDIYLSEHLTAKYAGSDKPHVRMTAAPLRGRDITNARWVFSSHKHSDHLDPGTLPDLFDASPHAQLVLPAAVIEHAVSLGLPQQRLIPTRGDETIQVGPLTVHSVPSAHPTLDYDEANGYPFLGYVLEVDGLVLYHSGDTLVYDGLAERLRRLEIDIAFLPINGTDERRTALQVPPNMNAGEAVGLAQAIAPRLVIPHHYDMFTFNTADVREFTRRADAAGLPYTVLKCGKRLIWKRDAGEV